MKNTAIIVSIFNLFLGISLIIRPDLLFWFEMMDDKSIYLSKLFGISISVYALFNYLTFRFAESEKLIRFNALLNLGFHLIVALQLHAFYANIDSSVLPFMIAYGIITISLVVIYLRNI